MRLCLWLLYSYFVQLRQRPCNPNSLANLIWPFIKKFAKPRSRLRPKWYFPTPALALNKTTSALAISTCVGYDLSTWFWASQLFQWLTQFSHQCNRFWSKHKHCCGSRHLHCLCCTRSFHLVLSPRSLVPGASLFHVGQVLPDLFWAHSPQLC